MRIKLNFALLLSLIITLSACDDEDDLTSFDVTDSLTETLNVDVPDNNGNPIDFVASETFDISSNQQINDNLDQLDNVEINSISYEISNFSGPEDATITDGSISFGNTIITVSDINLDEANTNNTTFEIDDDAKLSAISNNLENNTTVNVTYDASVDTTPVTFDMIMTIDYTVTINPL